MNTTTRDSKISLKSQNYKYDGLANAITAMPLIGKPLQFKNLHSHVWPIHFLMVSTFDLMIDLLISYLWNTLCISDGGQCLKGHEFWVCNLFWTKVAPKHYLLSCHNNHKAAKDLLVREPREPDNSTAALNGFNYLRWGVACECKSSGVGIDLHCSPQSLLCSWCHAADSKSEVKHVLKYSNKEMCIHKLEQM